ncbi:hypothetical protein M5K25_013539 [Dendrobium thyrsiflorum]|uniref:PhoD-like phosphatase metallophosphatase domain-containing protein n=1 Tax=Dendrobium thyrsiflorum TaxID=117978 RepID=A0ABD0V0H0_DENTH
MTAPLLRPRLLPFVFLLVYFSNLCKIIASETRERAIRFPKPQSPYLSDAVVTRIAFGSCANQSAPQPIWNAIIDFDPQLFIWLGDNIYGDNRRPLRVFGREATVGPLKNTPRFFPSEESEMRRRYQLAKAQPGYSQLRKRAQVIGTWDDHDYGLNDAGKEFSEKNTSQRLLLDFLDEPEDSARRSQAGVYASYLFGPKGKQVKVILLDTRYHRDPLFSDGTILGESQWKWLEKELYGPGSEITIIASSIQSILDVRQPLEAMFTSTQWLNSAWAKKPEGKEIRRHILSDKFWASVTYAILSTRPLVQVLRLVDAEKKPAMGFIYNAMDEVKELIAHNLGGEEANYREIWDIIDARWEVQLHRHLHAAAYYLNPQFQYSERKSSNPEVKLGLYHCMERLIPDLTVREIADLQLVLFRNREGFFGLHAAKSTIAKRSPVEWWIQFGDSTPELQSFAIRVLGLTCSSSGCERNWSTYNQVQTKRRNRLSTLRMNSLVYIMHNKRLRDRRLRNKGLKDDEDPLVCEDVASDNEWFIDDETNLPLSDLQLEDLSVDVLRGDADQGGASTSATPHTSTSSAAKGHHLLSVIKRKGHPFQVVSNLSASTGPIFYVESWGHFPKERERLYKLISDSERSGVFFISGDVHFAEITRYDCGCEYPLYDITSSGLTQAVERTVPPPLDYLLRLAAWLTPTTMRVYSSTCQYKSCTYAKQNFGVIEIDWDTTPQSIKFEVRSVNGKSVNMVKFSLTELQPKKMNRIHKQEKYSQHCVLEVELSWFRRHQLAFAFFGTLAAAAQSVKLKFNTSGRRKDTYAFIVLCLRDNSVIL